MILKVSDGAGGWHFFDNVERLYLKATKRGIKSKEEINGFASGDVINLVSKSCFLNGAVTVGLIELHCGGNKRSLLFTEVAYLCNDKGDTIECFNSRR